MIKKVVFAYVLILLFGLQYEDRLTVEAMDDCVDVMPDKEESPCYAEYKPICGCDGKTYVNDCAAMRAGVKNWRNGLCP